MKMTRIISFIVSFIISAAVLASCTVTPKESTPTGLDETARVTATPEDGRGSGCADDTVMQAENDRIDIEHIKIDTNF